MSDQIVTKEKDDFDQAFDETQPPAPGVAGEPGGKVTEEAIAATEATAAADATAAQEKADAEAKAKADAETQAAGGKPGDVIDWKARFDELQHSTDSWNGRLKASAAREKELQAQLEKVQAELAAAKKPPEVLDNPDSDPALKKALEEYPDVMGPVVSRIKVLNDKLRATEERLEKAANTAPLQQKVDQLEIQAHMQRITDVHPDAIQVAESKEFADWLTSRPAHLRSAYQTIYQRGTSDEINSMLSEYKSSRASGNDPAAHAAAEKKAAAEKAAADAKAAEEKKRQDQLKAAQTVRAAGGGPPPAAPDLNDFDAGWNASD